MSNAVAIIGGGFQGCLAALALSAAGKRVTIFERRSRLLQGASRNNEGKLHIGYTYGLDPSAETVELLVGHAAEFPRRLAHLLNREVDSLIRHHRAIYALHRASSLPLEAADAHMRRVDQLWRERQAGSGPSSQLAEPLRVWSESETRAVFGADVQAAYEVSEGHIDWHALCDAVGDAVEVDARISVCTGVRVARVDPGPRLSLIGEDGAEVGSGGTVINCAWEDMAGIAQRSGAPVDGLCLRAKAGFVARGAGFPSLPVTFSFGPFGDIVPLDAGRAYLSWYPACLAGFTTDMALGATWYHQTKANFDAARAYGITTRTLGALCPGMVPDENYERVQIGAILAAGRSDIVDLQSGLHRRTTMGISNGGRLYSVNTGKLVSAPTFATRLAQMI